MNTKVLDIIVKYIKKNNMLHVSGIPFIYYKEIFDSNGVDLFFCDNFLYDGQNLEHRFGSSEKIIKLIYGNLAGAKPSEDDLLYIKSHIEMDVSVMNDLILKLFAYTTRIYGYIPYGDDTITLSGANRYNFRHYVNDMAREQKGINFTFSLNAISRLKDFEDVVIDKDL